MLKRSGKWKRCITRCGLQIVFLIWQTVLHVNNQGLKWWKQKYSRYIFKNILSCGKLTSCLKYIKYQKDWMYSIFYVYLQDWFCTVFCLLMKMIKFNIFQWLLCNEYELMKILTDTKQTISKSEIWTNLINSMFCLIRPMFICNA